MDLVYIFFIYFLGIYYLGRLNKGGVKMTQLDIIKDFYETFSNDLDNFIDYLPMIVPDDSEDRKILMVALDMMKTLRSELKHVESVSDVSDTIDVAALLSDWADVKYTMNVSNSAKHRRDAIDRIVEGFYKDE